MTVLDHQIAAYESRQKELERDHSGRWVVFHDESLAGDYDSFEEAARDAVHRFGRGPYLIRRVGEERPLQLPASLLYHPADANA